MHESKEQNVQVEPNTQHISMNKKDNNRLRDVHLEKVRMKKLFLTKKMKHQNQSMLKKERDAKL